MTARVLVLDLETYRTRDAQLVEEIRNEAIAKEPSQNTLKELKANWNSPQAREQRAQDALAKTSVDVLHAEILCVGVKIDQGEPVVYSGMPDQEAEMLQRLANDLAAQTDSETIWVGHNELAFDLPILINRFRRHGIVPPESCPQPIGKKWRGRTFDTMLRTPSGNGLGMVSLVDACRAYSVPEPKTKIEFNGELMCGALVGAAFEAGEFDLIELYCAEDLHATRQLYDACTFGGKWGTWEVDDELDQAIAAIWASPTPHTKGDRAVIVLDILSESGKIPRRFAGKVA